MQIRPMEPREIDSVIVLFNYYKEEAEVNEERYSENRVLSTIREYCIRPNLFFRIALNGQRPVGLIGGFISEDPVEDERAATIQFCYLIPEFNSINNYQQMLEEFEAWAKLAKATNIRAIDIGTKITRLNEVYDELGFTPIRINIMNRELA